MQRRTLLIGIAWLVACNGRGLAGDTPYSTPLTAPWSAENLPVEAGKVVFSDAQMLTIRFDGGDRPALSKQFDAALIAAGHLRRVDTSAADMTSITYGKSGGTIVALGVLERHETVTVSLTRYER